MVDKIILYGITGLYFIFTVIIFIVKRKKVTIKELCIVGILAALVIVLDFLIAIPSLWGSTISFGAIAILLAGFLLGAPLGMLTGFISVLVLVLLGRWQILHPTQFFSEVYFCSTALGLTGLFNGNKKSGIILGTSLALILRIPGHFLTGMVFYGEYAPEGMNIYLYSFLYNFISEGLAIIIAGVLIFFLPLGQFKKLMGEENYG